MASAGRLLVASPGCLRQKGLPTKPAILRRRVRLHHRLATGGKREPWPLIFHVGKPVSGPAARRSRGHRAVKAGPRLPCRVNYEIK